VIDPLTALAGIQAAVALIKKVSKTVDDVSSLGPVLGKYFDAKSTATKAVVQAKKSKSSMGTASRSRWRSTKPDGLKMSYNSCSCRRGK
jgi:hypothetical protein